MVIIIMVIIMVIRILLIIMVIRILVIIMVIKIMMMIPDQVLCRLPNMLPHGGHHRRCLDQKNVFRQRLTNLSGKESLTYDYMHIL